MKRSLRYRVSPEFAHDAKGIVLGSKTKKELNKTTHILIGKLNEQGVSPNVWYSFENESVLGVFGKRGSGKSYTLGVILEGLACDDTKCGIGCNTGDRAVLLFDTLNIFQYSTIKVSDISDEQLRKESQNLLKIYNLNEKSLNFEISYPAGEKLSFYPESYKAFSIDTSLIQPEDYGHIFEIDIYKDPMGHLLLASYDAIKNTGYKTRGKEISGFQEAGLKELIYFLDTQNDICSGFSQETVRALTARLRTLYQKELFSGMPSAISDLIAKGKTCILLMGRLSPPLRSVVAALLIRQIFYLRSAAAEAVKYLKLNSNVPQRDRINAENLISQSPIRTLICIDELQGYAPPTKKNPCTEVIIQYVKEGRNHGLSFLFTSQQPSSVHSEVLSQMDGIISHQLSMKNDTESVLRNSKGRSPDKISSGKKSLNESSLLRELYQGVAWVSHSDVQRSFVIDIRPRITAHGGIEV